MNSKYLEYLIENMGVNNLLEAEGDEETTIETDDSITDDELGTDEIVEEPEETIEEPEVTPGSEEEPEEVIEEEDSTTEPPDIKILNLTSTQEQYNNRTLFEGMTKLVDSIDQTIAELSDSTWDTDNAYRIISAVNRRLTYLRDQLRAYQLAFPDSAEQNLQSFIIFAKQYKLIMDVIDKMNEERSKSMEEN